jgi:signal transduction histidine kinase
MNNRTDESEASLRSRLVLAPRLGGWVGCAAAVTAGGFVLCEFLQGSWSGELVSPSFQPLSRGVLASLLIALAVAWLMIRTAPGWLCEAAAGEDQVLVSRMSDAEKNGLYARWFIWMRWIALLVAGLLVFLSIPVAGQLSADVVWPLCGALAVLAGLNGLYLFLLRRGRGGAGGLFLQATLDLVVLAFLLHFSGGVENPLATMMIFHVIIGGILLSRKRCYAIAAIGSVLYCGLIFAEYFGFLSHYALFVFPHDSNEGVVLHAAHHPLFVFSRGALQASTLFLTAYFVTTLSERLRIHETRLEAMAHRATADRQLLERALETTGAALRVLTEDLTESWANNRWTQWFAGTSELSVQGAAFLNGERSPARLCLADLQIRVSEFSIERHEPVAGSAVSMPRTFQVTTAVLPDWNGRVRQVVELAQDVTRQKESQAQMLRAGGLAAVGELAGKVAHEVNNPIAIISAKTNLLLSDRTDEMSPKVASEIGKIRDLSDRVARIAQGLLSYCRPSTGLRTAIDVRQSLRRALSMVEQHARARGVRIEQRVAENLPEVVANSGELEQAFMNLFLNAIDAMPEGGELRVGARPEPVLLRSGRIGMVVSVEDSGHGIPEKLRERIFEPFFTTKEEGRGTGLGLSISLGLVRSQGGELELGEGTGAGACFLVKLPRAHSAQGQGERSPDE